MDGLTWKEYDATSSVTLRTCTRDFIGERTGRNRARRVYIPKADGRQRPLAVAALEDKIVQRATVAVLNAIYEEDFLGFSYGFRPDVARTMPGRALCRDRQPESGLHTGRRYPVVFRQGEP